jgi:GNAT superfamily N-acetyltransferase
LLWRALRDEDDAQLVSLISSQDDVQESAVNMLTPLLIGLHQVVAGQPGASLGGFDRAGVMRAAGILHLWPKSNTVVLHGVVDPAWSGRGIGGSLMAWQEGKGRQILASLPGSGRARMLSYTGESAANRRRLLMAAGFSPARSLYKTRRDLGAPIEHHELPDGLEWRSLTDVDTEALRLTHNAATREAWAPGPVYRELWDRRWSEYLPELSAVAFDPGEERIAGYALALMEAPTSTMAPRSEVYIHRLAVSLGYRGRGLGRALTSRVLEQSAAGGRRFSAITIDPAMNHSGWPMFEQFGFAPASRTIVYGLDL